MLRTLLLIPALLIALCVQAHDHDNATLPKSDTVFVKGLVQKPIAISVNDLQGVATTTLENQKLINASGATKRVLATAKGLLLRDIIRKAEIDLQNKDRGKYFVVVTAMDSSQIIFAYNELIFGPAADHAYLLLFDEKSSDAADGPFAVLCSSDIATVPRYLKWVRSIEVRKI
jgi:hypothetical protein